MNLPSSGEPCIIPHLNDPRPSGRIAALRSARHRASPKLTSRETICQPCPKRFRPIIMSTMAAMFGVVPLAGHPFHGDQIL